MNCNNKLRGDINEYLNQSGDWDSNYDENLHYMQFKNDWSREQEIDYLYRMELRLRKSADALLQSVINSRSDHMANLKCITKINNTSHPIKNIEKLNDSSNFGVYEKCKLATLVTERLLEYSPSEKWINSDNLYEWGMRDPELWMSYEYFQFFEKSVANGWSECRDHFISQNFQLTLWLKEWEQIYLHWKESNKG